MNRISTDVSLLFFVVLFFFPKKKRISTTLTDGFAKIYSAIIFPPQQVLPG
jgi:hypothetical protein